MGLDIHRKFSTVTARDGQDKIVWRQRLEHTDRPRMRARLADWPSGTPVVLEGTFGWGWMCDELTAAGLDPHLASSGKVAAWRKARGLAKSNRKDADLLSELWSEQGRWWEVWLAPPEVREQREWLRYRMTLVRTQTGLKNRIHAILHRHGILREQSDLFGRDGRRFLNLLVAPQDATLPDSARATLKGFLQLLDHVRRQIAAVTRQFRKQIEASPAARRLKTIPGIAWVLSYTILAEIGRRPGLVKVGFAAESEDLLANARGKLEEKGLDLIVANDVTAEGCGFGSDTNRVTLLDREGEEDLPLMSKYDVSARVLDRVVGLIGR